MHGRAFGAGGAILLLLLGCDENSTAPSEPALPANISAATALVFRQVSAGSEHTCAVNPYDVVFCWGSGWYGQLGNGSTTDRLAPVRVAAGGLRFHDVSAGSTARRRIDD